MSEMSYMEKLLDGVVVEWKALGEVIEPRRGRRLVRSQLQQTGKYAVYQNSMKPLGSYEESNVQGETTFLICAGAVGEIGYSAPSFWAADDVYYFSRNDQVNSKFLYHFLLTKHTNCIQQLHSASVAKIG